MPVSGIVSYGSLFVLFVCLLWRLVALWRGLALWGWVVLGVPALVLACVLVCWLARLFPRAPILLQPRRCFDRQATSQRLRCMFSALSWHPFGQPRFPVLQHQMVVRACRALAVTEGASVCGIIQCMMSALAIGGIKNVPKPRYLSPGTHIPWNPGFMLVAAMGI